MSHQDGRTTTQLNSNNGANNKGGDQFRVDTGMLDQWTYATRSVSSELAGADDRADNATWEAGRAMNKGAAGWQTAQDLNVLRQRWGQQVSNLKKMLEDIGKKLQASKSEYQEREQEETVVQRDIRNRFG